MLRMDRLQSPAPAFAPRAEHGRIAEAIAGAVARALAAGRRPLIRGLAEADFARLARTLFVGGETLVNGLTRNAATAAGDAFDEFDKFDEFDEFDDLLELLLAHRREANEMEGWLACALASAAMGENHLWQDMGLPNRDALSELIAEHFPALHAANASNMKWKKFFYRQLCASAGLTICRSPNCADCCDYANCFGPESGAAL